MAIYHAHLSCLTRSAAGSVASHAAYIAATIMVEERTGSTWDYTQKAKEVLSSNIISPEGSREWVYDAETLWKTVEDFEDYIANKRYRGHKDEVKNAKSLAAKEKFLSSCLTAYKANFALPLEITNKQHLIELSERIVKECYVAHGLVAQYAIHDMKGNPHLHIMATTRPLVDGSFAERRFFIKKPELVEIRKQMAQISNHFAQERGYDYHLDHRSYKDQGIKLVATKHLGPNARHRLQELSRNVQDNEEIRQKNIEILLNHPEELIKVVASQKAVFTQVDLCREIFKRVGGDEKLYAILKAKVDGIELPSIAMIGKTLNDNHLYESKSIQFDKGDYSRTIESVTAKLLSQEHAIYLGENIKGQAFYTSLEMKNLETLIAEKVEILKAKETSFIKEKYKLISIERTQKEERITFSEEQLGAINHLLSNQAMSVLTGKAGTGKSTVLKPVVEAYKQSGFTVIGTSFQGKVADQLSSELGIEGYTLDQLKCKWDDQDKYKRLIENKELKGQALTKTKAEIERLQKWRLTNKHVIILDEGSMVHGALWKGLLQEIERSGACLKIVQDNNQIKALHGLDAARLIEEKIGAYEIKSVVRQDEPWMREASSLLNEHCIEDGLKPYYERDHFDFRERDFEAKISLVADYLEGIALSPYQTHMALAQKNKDVVELNELIREALMSQGKLGNEFIFGREGIFDPKQSFQGPKTHHFRKSAYGRRFAVGDRVMFLENDHHERHVQTLEKGKNDRVGVKNGTLGVIESFDLKRQTVEVRLHDGRLVGFDSKSYDSLTHGYAVTINKSQGATFDHTYGFFSSFNSNQLLIWLTRHKETFKGYVSKGIASDLKGMVSHVARSDYKGLSTDYDLSVEQKPYFNLVQHYWKIAQEVGNLKIKIDALTLQAEQSAKKISLNKEWGHYNDLVQTRNKDASEILQNWSQCSTFMHQTGVRRETLEVQAGLRPRLLSMAEEAALEKVEEYFKKADQARRLWKGISQSHPGSLSHNHPEYKDYAKIKEIRNELAYEIASFPGLYKPFFRVKEQGKSYVTYSGTLYEKRPQGFKAVMSQAEQYIEHRKTQAYEHQLTFNERAAYKKVQEYRSLHYKAVASFNHKKSIQEIIQKRDRLAYEIVFHYSIIQPFVGKLGLKEETFLKHAVLGEGRTIIEAYQLSKNIEEKTKLADHLVSYTLNEQGSADKALYSLLRQENLDFQRLKFEQGWYKAHQDGKELSIHTLQELEQAYHDLTTFREKKQVQDQWTILNADTSKLDHFPDGTPHNNKVKLERKKSSLEIDLNQKKVVNTYDREQVLACLTSSHIEGIFARHIEGWVANPKCYIKSHEIRYGQYKEFWVNRQTGAWYNFAAGEGGDIFKYISKSQGIRYGEAIKYLGTELNAPQLTSLNWEEGAQRQNELKLQTEREEQLKIEKSQEKTNKLYKASHPIQGTLAEQYLKEHRKINTAGLPSDLRFILGFKDYESHKIYPALAAFARDAEGKLTAAQVTCLDPNTANKADIDVKKRSLGTIKGTAVEIQAEDGPTYIAEGIETALSLKEAGIQGRILVTLGLSNMRNVGSHIKDKDQPVILCCDADEIGSSAWKSSEQNLKKLQEEGFKASITRPQGEKGRDFNDILQEEGIAAVQEVLKDIASFKKRLPQKETLFPQHTSLHSSKTEVISPQLGKSANAQKEITQGAFSQEESEKYGPNALELYLSCKEKLKTLPSIMKAQSEEKLHIKKLNKESLYHAHIIWKDKDLKQQACNLGLEAEIQKKAEIYHYDIAWDLHSKKIQEENALDLYLKCELKLKNLPSIVVAKGQEKEEVKALLKQARLHAHAVYQDPSLKMKAQELGLEKAIKHHAQIHKQEMEQSIKQSSSFKFSR
ncbi:hypothetical protein IM40_09300 (plasmid) [Candidatus Paracaedimonas acanthamoebae]|nr:hypothetical protein IM40_09300 [Candidatus Paracaedimonas acanthamoebae]